MDEYVGRFTFFHLEIESFGGTVETEIVAAGEHEDVFGEVVALGAGLWLIHIK